MKSKALKIFSLLIVSSTAYSCTAETPNTVTSPNPGIASANPAQVDSAFIASFEPTLSVGMKYTYISSISGSSTLVAPQENSTEILAIEGDNVKVRITDAVGGTQEKTLPKSELAATGVTNSKFVNEGKEDVKVPAGEYKGSTKVSLTNTTGKLTLWLFSGIGVVKSTIFSKTAGTLITELKEFKK